MAYLLAAVAVSGIFVIAGWRSNRSRGLNAMRGSHGLPADPLWGDAEIDIGAAEARTDVRAAFRLALKRLAPLIASQSVQAEIACPSGLLVRMRGAALVDLLEGLLTASIHSAPDSRLLMTASRHGERVYIAVTDDMPGADPEVRQSNARGLMERVAMRGGALDINVRPAEGTTVTLRLAVAPADDRRSPESAVPRSDMSRALAGRGGR
ncbi:MAG: hypothetical protein QOF70_6932 [Acetobacteraceae bacterium]|jgi:hypothetical protein|nr:hypothetical protein [Acetobacteraceae bacterium]